MLSLVLSFDARLNNGERALPGVEFAGVTTAAARPLTGEYALSGCSIVWKLKTGSLASLFATNR